MPTPLPAATDYTAAANQGAKKTFMTALRTSLAELFGSAGHGFDGALLAAPRRITLAGTADAMTATLAPAITAYTTGMRVTGLLPGANTVTGPTLHLNALGAKTIKKRSGTGAKVALVAGDYNATLPFEFEYDGTDFVLLNPLVAARADVASAGTLDLSATSGSLRITGTTAVTAVTLASGQLRHAIADGALPLTHGASLILPGAANYTCAAGDALLFIGEPSGVVRVAIWKADGTAVAGSGLATGAAIATSSGSAQGRTGISANAKQITLPISAISTNGTAILQIQIGDSGGYEATGYAARCANSGGANTGSTTGFVITSTNFAAGSALSGVATLSLVDSATNTWAIAGTVMDPGNDVFTFSGSKSLSGTLDRVQFITTDTFDGGSFNTQVAS